MIKRILVRLRPLRPIATLGTLGTLAAIAAASLGAAAQSTLAPPDTKPYDERLMRLCEVLGAVHYLRELMEAEGSSALRRAKLTRSFNNGYRSYSRTYSTCTASAQTAITRFLAEGADIAEGLTKSVP